MADEALMEPAQATAIQAPSRSGEGALALKSSAAPVGALHSGEILPPKRRKKRVLLPFVMLAALSGGGYEGYRWFIEGRFIVATDDAYVKADTSTIAAKVAGYVTLVPVANNAVVTKGQVLARIDEGDYQNAVDSATARIETQDATDQPDRSAGCGWRRVRRSIKGDAAVRQGRCDA